ncbi:Hypp448 [Branchiostoma lanceolatum]|uniref:Hypp448 protein n=1 Tax=Branchiostoma lanceolatum TaxID=7740 RepID=A0A8J9W409_BRALA|nr:Hypp448 [Branchiostoma lanceolatum]
MTDYTLIHPKHSYKCWPSHGHGHTGSDGKLQHTGSSFRFGGGGREVEALEDFQKEKHHKWPVAVSWQYKNGTVTGINNETFSELVIQESRGNKKLRGQNNFYNTTGNYFNASGNFAKTSGNYYHAAGTYANTTGNFFHTSGNFFNVLPKKCPEGGQLGAGGAVDTTPSLTNCNDGGTVACPGGGGGAVVRRCGGGAGGCGGGCC